MDEAIELRLAPNPKWVRGVIQGRTIVDSREVQFVWENPYYNVAICYLDAAEPRLHDLVRIEWDALDAWFEEEVEVFVHPRSPEARVDVLPSSKSVRVSIDGVTVAESSQPTLLFETGLPTRYYLPKSDVRMRPYLGR